MKLFLLLFASLAFSLSSFSFSNEANHNGKLLVKPPYREYMKSTFNVRLYQSFGFRHVGWDLDVSYQFRQYFSIGIGNGFHRNKFPIYSTSDKHVLKMWSYPIYLTGNVYLFGNLDRACYIYGKYGRQFGLNTKGVRPSDDFKAIMAEGGLGYQLINGDKNIYFELGQYYTSANGVFNSTYNSTIEYDLQIYTLVGRVGFRLNF